MESGKNRDRRSLCRRMAQRYRGAQGLPFSGTVLWRGGHGATVYGCHRILSYAPDRILLLVGRKTLEVTGEGLWCASFSSGCVTVEGQIRSIACTEEGV